MINERCTVQIPTLQRTSAQIKWFAARYVSKYKREVQECGGGVSERMLLVGMITLPEDREPAYQIYVGRRPTKNGTE